MVQFIDNNFELYKSSKSEYIASLNYAKSMSHDVLNKKLVFHCLWRVPKNFGRKQAAVLKSIIVNHYENINDLEINLWSNVDLSSHESLVDISSYINFKHWDFDSEKKGTIFENYKKFNNDTIKDKLCWVDGDLFRLLILYKYGGFYIDMDVLVLRNMLPLNDYEFLYQWGTSGNREEPFSMNGAIMRLNKYSKLSHEMLDIACDTDIVADSFNFGNKLYSRVHKNSILALPCIWFNSEWGFEGTFMDPFKNIGTPDLFDGAFTWHWHNKWDDIIEDGSKFQILEAKHNMLFNTIKAQDSSSAA